MAAPQRAVTLNRPNMVSVGTIVFLSQELMFFAGLFAMYFVSEGELRG
jgi:cytochrome c oxidase subunit 3